MTAWWEAMSKLQHLFVYMALPATMIMMIQTILIMIGIGGDEGELDSDFDADFDTDLDTDFDGDIDVDFDGDFGSDIDVDAEAEGFSVDAGDKSAMRLFTIRGIVAFFAVSGWMGVWLIDLGLHESIVLTLAFLSGLAALWGIAKLFQLSMKLQSSGNVKTRNALGITGEVYIPIPPHRSGQGKVTMTVQGRFREFDAMTDSPVKLATGTIIKVTDIISNHILIVETDI